jgi:hypothetical protein
MTLKIAFQKPISEKTLCLGVFEENTFSLPAQTWDNTLKGLLKKSIENSKFKGKLNQTLNVFTPEGVQIILIGLKKIKRNNIGKDRWRCHECLELLPTGDDAKFIAWRARR